MRQLGRKIASALSVATLSLAVGCSVGGNGKKEAVGRNTHRLMQEATVPLSLYRHVGHVDDEPKFRLTSDPSFATHSEWELVAVEGYVAPNDQPQPPGTVPLKTWLGSERYTTQTDESSVPSDYEFVRLEGYVYPSSDAPVGSVPLFQFFSESVGLPGLSTTMDPTVGDEFAFSPDFVAIGDIGYIRPARPLGAALAAHEAFVPIFQYYDEAHDRYRLSTELDLPEFTRLRQEGFVFSRNDHPAGATALYTWHCDAGAGDTYETTTDPSWGPNGIHDGCEFIATEGYVFMHAVAGTVALDAHFASSTTEKWYVAPTGTAPAGYDGFVRRNGFIRPVVSTPAASRAPTMVRVSATSLDGAPIELHPNATQDVDIEIERLELDGTSAEHYGFTTYEGPVTIYVSAFAKPIGPEQSSPRLETVSGSITIPQGMTTGTLTLETMDLDPDADYFVTITGDIRVVDILNGDLERISPIEGISKAGYVNLCGTSCPPKKPALLEVEATYPDRVDLRWITRVSTPAETQFQIEYRQIPDDWPVTDSSTPWSSGNWRGPATIYNKDWTRLTEGPATSALAQSTRYLFRVKATNSVGTAVSREVPAKTGVWPTPAPGYIRAAPFKCGVYPFMYVAPSGAGTFDVQREDLPGAHLFRAGVAGPGDYTVEDRAMTLGAVSTYRYRVHSFNPGRDWYSDWITVKASACPAPSSPTPVGPSGGPDLIVTSLFMMDGLPYYSRPVQAHALISNAGSVSAASSRTRWDVSTSTTSGWQPIDALQHSVPTPPFPAGLAQYVKSADFYIGADIMEDTSLIYDPTTGASIHLVECTADHLGTVGDRDASNNLNGFLWRVRSAPP